MDNGVPLTLGGLGSLHAATYLHDVAAIRGSFYGDGREAELESVYIMGWAVNNLMLRRGLESILGGVDDACNADGEMISVRNGNNPTGCRYC